MTEPTDADRANAAELIVAFQDGMHSYTDLGRAIAAALAAERAAAVAEAWDEAASELELSGHSATHWAVVGFRRRATALRAAVTDTTGGTQQ